MDVKLKAATIRELARIYPNGSSIARIASWADLNLYQVQFEAKPIDAWFSIVELASNQNRMSDLLEVALVENESNGILRKAFESLLNPITQLPNNNLGSEPDSPERLMGKQSTLLPVSFLAKGLEATRSVARIDTEDSHGTGFVIGNDLMVTNNHVIPSPEVAVASSARFNFQLSSEGIEEKPVVCKFRPNDAFITSATDDLTVVRIEPGTSNLWGQLDIATDFSPQQISRVNIVQHPGGGPKQVALYHNLVTYCDGKILQYYTDTLPGSSGSPLFDDRWKIVGIHHAGGNLYSPSEGKKVFTNEGIAAPRLLNLLGQIDA